MNEEDERCCLFSWIKKKHTPMMQPVAIPPLSDEYVVLEILSTDGKPKKIMIRRRMCRG